jgi:uncharacterized protein (DUF58 family)
MPEPAAAGLRAHAARRIAAWIRKRQGEDRLPLTLQSRRLYILPTRAGLAFGVLLLVMMVTGLNYSNSLALMLTFTLAAFVLVGMLECQRTLRGLQILQARANDCVAGGTGLLELRFANPGATPRRVLAVRCAGAAQACFEVDAASELLVRAPFAAGRRGRQRLERLELATHAPFGLFRAWTWLHLPVEVIVFPRAAGERPLPHSGAWHQSRAAATTGGEPEQWTGLRPFVLGDSPRSIAWKAYARGRPMMVGVYEGEGGDEHRLGFSGLETLPLEARLQQLAAWVERCAATGAAYTLELPAARLGLGAGAQQRTAALRLLALYGEAPP